MPGLVLTAPEPSYGVVPTTGWQSNGLNTDSFKSRQDILQRQVLRRRTAAPPLAGRRIIDRGGEASIEIDAGTNGLGLYLAAAASTAESAVVMGGTDAYQEVFEWTADGPPVGDSSIAALVYRSLLDGVENPDAAEGIWQYAGGKVTEFEVGQNLDGFLTMKFSMDFLTAALLDADPDYLYEDVFADTDFLYAWPDAEITITPKDPEDGDPATECLSAFSFTLPTGVNVNRWCLKRGTGKHEPSRNQTPKPTGTLEWLPEHTRYYEAFRNGTPFSVTADWQAPVAIEGSTFPSLTIEIGTIVFEEPNDPEAQIDDDTKQTAPFVILDDESGDPVVTITQVTTDTTLTEGS